MPNSERALSEFNANRKLEEHILRHLDELRELPWIDQRWLAIGRTRLEEAFMCLNRALIKQGRIALPEDAAA